MTLSQILRAARETIADPKHWTQGAYARDKHGVPVDSLRGEGCTFCTFGAVRHVVAKENAEYFEAEVALDSSVPRDGMGATIGAINFNDAPTTTHADVLALFDRAIARAEAQETRAEARLDA
jgi:hypothetical protein